MRWFLRQVFTYTLVTLLYIFIYIVSGTWWVPLSILIIALIGTILLVLIMIVYEWTWDYEGKLSLGKYLKEILK